MVWRTLFIIVLVVAVGFCIWLGGCAIWEFDTQSIFQGDIKIVASGECLRQYDCYGNLSDFKIGNLDILSESETWDLFRVPTNGELKDSDQNWNKLVVGKNYTLYKKSFGKWGIKSSKNKSFGRTDLTSYFIECN